MFASAAESAYLDPNVSSEGVTIPAATTSLGAAPTTNPSEYLDTTASIEPSLGPSSYLNPQTITSPSPASTPPSTTSMVFTSESSAYLNPQITTESSATYLDPQITTSPSTTPDSSTRTTVPSAYLDTTVSLEASPVQSSYLNPQITTSPSPASTAPPTTAVAFTSETSAYLNPQIQTTSSGNYLDPQVTTSLSTTLDSQPSTEALTPEISAYLNPQSATTSSSSLDTTDVAFIETHGAYLNPQIITFSSATSKWQDPQITTSPSTPPEPESSSVPSTTNPSAYLDPMTTASQSEIDPPTSMDPTISLEASTSIKSAYLDPTATSIVSSSASAAISNSAPTSSVTGLTLVSLIVSSPESITALTPTPEMINPSSYMSSTIATEYGSGETTQLFLPSGLDSVDLGFSVPTASGTQSTSGTQPTASVTYSPGLITSKITPVSLNSIISSTGLPQISSSLGVSGPSATSTATSTLPQPTTGVSPSQTSSASGVLSSNLPAEQESENSSKHPIPKALTRARYFLGAYLPTLLAVCFRLSVGWLYATTKMLEPFYALMNPDGALPKDFFHINYLSTNDSWDPFRAMLSGHRLMLWTSILYVAVGLLTPFASELLRFGHYCQGIGDGKAICGPELRVNPTVARILEALLSFAAAMLIVVWWLQRKQKSGVYADPSSIASLVSLLHNPEVVADFQSIHPGATKDDMTKVLADRRYCLDRYQATDGTERYGLVVAGGVASNTTYDQSSVYERVHKSDEWVDLSLQEQSRHRHRIYRACRDIVFGLITAGILILITYYYKTGFATGFERFMDSQGFGPRFVFAIVGISIHSQWKRLERGLCPFLNFSTFGTNPTLEAAIIEPFRRLYAGNSHPSASILVHRTLNPTSTLLTSLLHRRFFVAHIASVAILAEALIILLPGIPFSAGQLESAFVLSAILSISILGYMLLSLAAVWLRPKGPALPRTPNTLAAVWSYLCGAKMLGDFADLAILEARERDRIVGGMGRVYGLRVEKGTDGVERWGVDYDGDGRAD